MIARSQAKGRGRGGRAWSSPPGNLYASLLLRLRCPLPVVQQLALLAPVALFDATSALLGPAAIALRMRLKWPNDLLVDGAKVSGILLESMLTRDGGVCVVLGFGLNLASHPQGLDQPATHLAAHGCSASPDAALSSLASATDRWLQVWGEGAGFADIRAAWLDRAGPLGEPLWVRVSTDPAASRLDGSFAGLDGDGALLLDHADGTRSRHVQGDVALGPADR